MSFAQRSFRASTAAVAYAMEPLFAAIFAAGMLHESLTPLTIAGGVLIIAANVLVGLRAHSSLDAASLASGPLAKASTAKTRAPV